MSQQAQLTLPPKGMSDHFSDGTAQSKDPSLPTSTKVVTSSLASCPSWPWDIAPAVSGGCLQTLELGLSLLHGSHLTGKKSQSPLQTDKHAGHHLLPALISSSLPYCTPVIWASRLSLPQGLCTFSTLWYLPSLILSQEPPHFPVSLLKCRLLSLSQSTLLKSSLTLTFPIPPILFPLSTNHQHSPHIFYFCFLSLPRR